MRRLSKFTVIAAASAISLGATAGVLQASQRNTPAEPPTASHGRPPWVLPDGRVDQSKLPSRVPVYGLDGKVERFVDLRTHQGGQNKPDGVITDGE